MGLVERIGRFFTLYLEAMNEFWNQRYDRADYVYGEEPNEFLRLSLEKMAPGSVLLPAEGEGRNAAYAARKGWRVHAFDISDRARTKALQLAEKAGVTIDYQVAEFEAALSGYAEASFDAIALIYLHLPPQLAQVYFSRLLPLLKPGGVLIFEGFSKAHRSYQLANPEVGGPGSIEAMYTPEEVQAFFHPLTAVRLVEQEIELTEGWGHHGKAKVVRFVGKR